MSCAVVRIKIDVQKKDVTTAKSLKNKIILVDMCLRAGFFYHLAWSKPLILSIEN